MQAQKIPLLVLPFQSRLQCDEIWIVACETQALVLLPKPYKATFLVSMITEVHFDEQKYFNHYIANVDYCNSLKLKQKQ